MTFAGTCPNCSAPIQFGVANSLVVICESCSSALGRGDGKLEDYGKVADLVRTDSPLQIGLSGEVKGAPFEVTGRVQLQHAAGGVWDEWYVAFRGGEKWGWLAEAQGRYYLTFRKKLPQRHSIPVVADLEIEDAVPVPSGGVMKVVEIGEATTLAAEGEIPYAFHPGEKHVYADLQGQAGKFATLDYSEEVPVLFLGGEFPLSRLGISETAESREDAARQVSSVSVACPQCGGSLDLKAPDETMRVACPYCESMLEATEGNLKFLQALSQPKFEPVIPLGSEGNLRGRKYTVIGCMQRKVSGFSWREYLLYTPREPFHWLIHSSRHWTLGKPVAAADVNVSFHSATWNGKPFRIFERSTPVVDAVYGEFYWQVKLGDRVGAADYVRPPYLLSREETISAKPAKRRKNKKRRGKRTRKEQPEAADAGQSTVADDNEPEAVREVNYTLGQYVPVEEIETAFGLTGLSRPSGVGLNQPYKSTGVYLVALCMLAAAILAGCLVTLSGERRQVFQESFPVQPSVTVFSRPFEVLPRRNLRVTCESQTSTWVHVRGSFYNEKSGAVKSFASTVETSSNKRSKFLSALPGGKYSLRLEMKSPETVATGRKLVVTVHQGVPRLQNWLVLIGLLATIPIGVALHQLSFEQRRWSDSDFSPLTS